MAKCPQCGDKPSLREDCILCGGTMVVEDTVEPGDKIPEEQLEAAGVAHDSEGLPRITEPEPTGSTFDTEPLELKRLGDSPQDERWQVLAVTVKEELLIVMPNRLVDLTTLELARAVEIIYKAYEEVFGSNARIVQLDKFLFLSSDGATAATSIEDHAKFRDTVASLNVDGALYKRIAKVTKPTQATVENEE